MTGREPHLFERRVLLVVTGLSPQVVTETLYAIAHASRPAFVPTEVHLVTTVEGAARARASLLDPPGAQFLRLLQDYPTIGRPAFGTENIHVLPGSDGRPMADIRTPADNAAAANAIAALVGALTSDERAALHVSIAGGRKTMGFYLGYAFSLFARPQDRLSHVLVSAPFESHPEFFYPPPAPRLLEVRGGGEVDSAHAVVTLAEIPVVRLRHGMPEALQRGAATFSEAVAAVQEHFAAPSLEVNLAAARVTCGTVSVPMKPQIVAWCAWWAWLRRSGKGAEGFVGWREAGPHVAAFLDFYRTVVGEDSADYEATAALLKEGMEPAFFQQKNSRLESAMRAALGPGAGPYLLAREGRRPHTKCGFRLAAAEIRITGASRRFS